jgi:uncharacterized membrane protein
MTTRTTVILVVILSIILLAAGLIASPNLQQPIATHWGADGQANGYGSLFTAVWLLPLMTLGIGLLLLALPIIDPLKRNIALFRKEWNGMVIVFVLFMGWVHATTLAWNLGLKINMNLSMMPAMSLLFFYMAWLLPRSRRNWFLGIRTPWTLSSDTVWEKTHRLGGWCFAAAGLISLISLLFGEPGFVVMMVGVMIAALVPVVYSYILFQAENRNTQ